MRIVNLSLVRFIRTHMTSNRLVEDVMAEAITLFGTTKSEFARLWNAELCRRHGI